MSLKQFVQMKGLILLVSFADFIKDIAGRDDGGQISKF